MSLTKLISQLSKSPINNLLAFGRFADERDASLENFDIVNFLGKTVVDLGCHLGKYSFFARFWVVI